MSQIIDLDGASADPQSDAVQGFTQGVLKLMDQYSGKMHPVVMLGILHSLGLDVYTLMSANAKNQQAMMAVRAAQEAAKIKPQ